ncbi:5-hydroxytryptamine receptor 1E-like [Mizuhopecten yessoensis]|uniref:Melanopsin-B n=1 Tax=Mizuhopecten yessoensis TaxID=6573 RepID=A0A210QIK8_MIZYE|nr:5-hydroxytryptamine receptor 1E-like [Mizuhopecten yessoensis]OWF48615.1 Melanopsin-B [Mizuhopecten yessoensis]
MATPDETKYGFGISIAVIAVLTLVLNVLFLFVFFRRKKMRIPAKYFVANLAFVDILAAGLWTSFSVLAVFGDGWDLSYSLCKLQQFFANFCVLMNMHTLLFLAFERTLMIYKPSRHFEVFRGIVMIIAIAAIWTFDVVLSLFPVSGWGEVAYFTTQYQCAMDYDQNVRQMHFSTAITFGIPIVFLALCYVLIFIRIKKLRDNMSPEGAMTLEVNDVAAGDTYAARLKRQQLKFQDAGRKRKKPTIGKEVHYTADGYESNDSSTDEEDEKERITKKPEQQGMKRVYYLSKNDYELVKTYLITTFIVIALWYPHIIITYVDLYESNVIISANVIRVLVWLTHAAAFVKPIIYFLHNTSMRTHLKKAFCKRDKYKQISKKSGKYAGNDEDENGVAQTEPEV